MRERARRRARHFGAVSLVLALLYAAPGAAEQPSNIEEVTAIAGLKNALEACGPSACRKLVYFWSPAMPLSQLGVAEIAVAADALGLPVVVAPDSVLGRHDSRDARRLADRFIDAGASVHYPSVVIADGAKPRGHAVVGYRHAEGYRAALANRLEGRTAGEDAEPAPLGSILATPAAGEREPAITWRQKMNPIPGAFYRHVPGAPYISFDLGEKVYLQDTRTGRRFPAPGFVDFVPTPDGRLFVTPGKDQSGLELYLATEVIRLGRLGDRSAFKTAFKDSQMTDQYPSIGIIARRSHGSTRYRVATSKFEGLVFRDYDVRWRGIDDAVITPASPVRTMCSDLDLSTPILSKDGREVAARDEATGTTAIFRVDEAGRCDKLRDLEVQTSKVSFSNDRRLIAFGAPDGYGHGHTYVMDRVDGEVVRVPGSRSDALVIPEMIENDAVMFLTVTEQWQKSGVSRTSELRIACCFR